MEAIVPPCVLVDTQQYPHIPSAMLVLLSTPLLKIPLLVGNAVCTYYAMTPPSQPPPLKEQLRFAIPAGSWMTRSTRLQLAVAAASKVRTPSSSPSRIALSGLLTLPIQYVLCGASIAEAVVLLAPLLPQPCSSHILTALLPLAVPPYARTHALAALQLTPLSAAACLLGILGGAIRVWCHRTLGTLFTWQVAVRSDHKLITRGPYALVRHPSYTGWLLLIIGNFALLASRGSYFVESGLSGTVVGRAVVLANFVYCLVGMGNLMRRVGEEDRVLRKEFGKEWEAWAGRTQYRLIPFVY